MREESPDSLVVASGFGRNSQWFRNVVAEPRCHVSIGVTRRRPAVATVLDTAESEEALAYYRQAHPGSWEKLSAIIVEATGETDPDLPLVRLELQPVRSVR
ncbi:MAG: nitroreductase family deazaflavin-dependent oxidoreductase [Actinomycetota bacterium]|nr:nitroreductase family deazaflavin-dependent oxidoreductase [Actinomycetota bacterium]